MTEFVRVRQTGTGHHISVKRSYAEARDWEILDQPAVDRNGRALPPKYNTSSGSTMNAETEQPAEVTAEAVAEQPAEVTAEAVAEQPAEVTAEAVAEQPADESETKTTRKSR